MPSLSAAGMGVVAIGRNEGARLKRCLESALTVTSFVVYVDSGSVDGSLDLAAGLGVTSVALDLRIPFTAARARNEGFECLRQKFPEVEYVQFVDGDCELMGGWLRLALEYLEEHNEVAVVCGRRRERFPDRTVYNKLCDIEWDTPVGLAKYCGGDAMMRAQAFEQVGGFRPDLIAGEEPELCVRLRAKGWTIWRLDAEMTLHDAAMVHFGQWWKRAMRGGFAFAEGAHLHGAFPERHWIQETRRIWFWGLLLPLIVLASSVFSLAFAGLILLLYPFQIVRLATMTDSSIAIPWTRAFFLVAGKFPEMFGQAKFVYSRLFRQRIKLIEYK